MSGERPLSDLQPGERGRVVRIEMVGAQRRRLLDLGLIPGTVVTVAFASPLGDPVSYRVREALIALRGEQAAQIIVSQAETVRND